MIKPHLTLAIGMLLLCLNSYAQTPDFAGPVNTGMGHVKVFSNSPWAPLNNIASLSQQQHPVVGTSYQLRFNMDELSSRVLTAVIPTNYGIVSGLVLQNGYSKSLYNRYALGFSRLFGDKASVGLQFNYITHHIESADNAGAFYSSFGLQMDAAESLQLGVFIQNAEQSKISYNQISYPLPTFFNAALKWCAGTNFLIIGEFEKEMDHDPVYKTGVQLGFNERLFVRSGIKAKPVEFTFGGGFSLGKLNIDVGFSHHQQLGMTSAAGLSYVFNKGKQE